VLIHLSHCLNASEQGGNGENGEFEVQRLEPFSTILASKG
jgi:hypothetical protein